MKKACVATYCEWSSYGSIMQAIGLKKMLLQLGVESFVVRDCPAPLSEKYFPPKFGKSPKQILLNIINNSRRSHQQRGYAGAVNFINKHVDVLYYDDYETLKKAPPVADYYIAGSDQIWHPELCSPLFFLDFVDEGVKKLSYAASMGVTAVSKEREEEFFKLLNGFSPISVREREVEEVIKSNTQARIDVHIDPTFLRPAEEWRQLSNPYPVKNPYILVYAIYWNRNWNRELKKLHRETGYDIVALGTGFPTVWCNRWISDADPGQFLWLIDHAQAVVTSSFHGVAFSLIFNKKLAAAVNPSAPSRICNILDTLHYTNAAIGEVMDVKPQCFETVNENIRIQQDRSTGYLKEILEIHE